jgi:paraquat-inducible protein A
MTRHTRRAADIGVIGCDACGLVVTLCSDGDDKTNECPRCCASLRKRPSHRMVGVWLPLLLAMMCYAAALILPVMNVASAGNAAQSSTVVGGIVDLWDRQSYGIAAIIFVAAILVPCAKFLALMAILLSGRLRSPSSRRLRSRIHGFVETFGHWSMLDVVILGLLVSLVQFQSMAALNPMPAVICFSLSVILTMVAAHAFDPRTIWNDQPLSDHARIGPGRRAHWSCGVSAPAAALTRRTDDV